MKAILDFILKDEDFFCAKNIIILSQTFYILNEKKEKIYLQKNIENHSVFKNLDFWQNFIQITITNTINESIEYDTKNGIILKDKHYIMEIEEEKLQTNELTNKIFAFSNKNISLPEIKDEELEILKNLMSKIEKFLLQN